MEADVTPDHVVVMYGPTDMVLRRIQVVLGGAMFIACCVLAARVHTGRLCPSLPELSPSLSSLETQ
jgi:hypothetical protein